MNLADFLPQRWRSNDARGRHNAVLGGILSTPPIQPRHDGLVLFATIGSDEVLPFLLAVKSLWRQLERGRVVVLDDGTLVAQDRTVLAQHCGDPEILRVERRPDGVFPQGRAWDELLTVLDRRAGEYWLRVAPDTLTLGPAYEIERALGSNRSAALLGGRQAPEVPLALREFACRAFPSGPAERGQLARIESRLGEITGVPAWRYLRACPSLTGFAAGNAGRELAAAFHARLADLVGPDLGASAEAAWITGNFLIANETQPVCLPRSRYCDYYGLPWDENAALIRFALTAEYDDGAWEEAAGGVIATLAAGERPPNAG